MKSEEGETEKGHEICLHRRNCGGFACCGKAYGSCRYFALGDVG